MEEDGSVTLSLNEIDLVENVEDEEDARFKLGKSILEYSSDYYNEYETYSHSPNRKKYIPYIFKALIMDDAKKIGVEANLKKSVASHTGIFQQQNSTAKYDVAVEIFE